MGMVDFKLNIHASIKLPSATQYYTLKEVCYRGKWGWGWILAGKDGENSQASASSVLAVTRTAPKD